MKVTVHFTSQGRLLEGSLFLPEEIQESAPTLLFEGSMTGTTNQFTEYLAREACKEGFVCLLIDHNYFGEQEGASQPWESPVKRQEDIKAALAFLSQHEAVNKEQIVSVGVGVGAEYLAQVFRENHWCKGLAIVEGPFDDSSKLIRDLEIPTLVVPETPMDEAVDKIVIWARTLLKGGTPGLGKPFLDWANWDK